MTITITALTNDRARLIARQATFMGDEMTADMVADLWEDQGYIVTRSVED